MRGGAKLFPRPTYLPRKAASQKNAAVTPATSSFPFSAPRPSASGADGVGHDVFQHRDVLDETLAAVRGQHAQRLRAIVLEALPNLDQAGLAEDLQMPAQVAVGEGRDP